MTRQKPDASPPVIAGSSSLANHPGSTPVTIVEIMRRAVEAAIDQIVGHGVADRSQVLDTVDLVMAPRGNWSENDPARAAVRLLNPDGVAPRSVVTEIGVLQQTVVHLAFEAVRSGEARSVLIVGGEAKYSADREGVGRDPEGDVTEPDEVLRPHGDLVHRVEIAHRVWVPAQQYALIESAIAHREGRTIDEQARVAAELWADGSHVASERPDAWRRTPFTAEDVLAIDGGNRMIAEPYRRAVVSSWTVDQSVCLLVTRAETAAAWGLPEHDMVGLVGSAVSEHMLPLVEREDLADCPAFRLGAEAIAAATGIHPRDADVLDLYSCFPSAVQIAARDLGVEGRPWTVTGGMATFGGPFNSYALHGIAVLAEHLRGRPGRLAANTCVSGLLTKAGVGLWCCGPGEAVLFDVTAADADARRALEVVDQLDDPVAIVAETVVPSAPSDDHAETVIQIAEDSGRRRTIRTQTR